MVWWPSSQAAVCQPDMLASWPSSQAAVCKTVHSGANPDDASNKSLQAGKTAYPGANPGQTSNLFCKAKRFALRSPAYRQAGLAKDGPEKTVS